MAQWIQTVALGKWAYYTGLPAANDALVLVLLKSTGLEAESALRDHDTLAAILAAANDECDATSYARKVITASVTVTPDDTNNRTDGDFPDQTFTALGNTATAAGSGAGNNVLGAAIVCYDPDTTGGSDSDIIPLAVYELTASTDGTDLVLQLNAAGFARAAAAAA